MPGPRALAGVGAGHEESRGQAQELSSDGHLGDSGVWYIF